MPIDFSQYDRCFVAFSGGKDSVASFLTLREKVPLWKIVLVFSDTCDELPETYDYLKYFDENVFSVIRLCQKIVGHSDTGRRSIENEIISWDVPYKQLPEMGVLTLFDEIRNRFKSNPNVPVWPSKGIRYCTKHLKVNPFFKFIRSLVNKNDRDRTLIVRGLRQEESKQRSKTSELVMDEVNGDFYNFYHPVYDLTTEEVFDLHRKHCVKINPVYDYRERSNCAGCPFARNSEIAKTVEIHPNVFEPYLEIEKETGYTWKNNYSIQQAMLLGNEDKTEDDLNCNSGYCDI